MSSNGHRNPREVVPSELFLARCDEVRPYAPQFDQKLEGARIELALREDRDIEGAAPVGGPVWAYQTNTYGGAVTGLWIYYTAAGDRVVLKWVDLSDQDVPSKLVNQ